MRASILLLVFAVGCVADPTEPETVPTATPSTVRIDMTRPQFTASREADPAEPDVCGLAAQLPADDICSKVCDPDAMKAQLLADGDASGACYEFRCTMPDDSHVIVGVCLPPPQ